MSAARCEQWKTALFATGEGKLAEIWGGKRTETQRAAARAALFADCKSGLGRPYILGLPPLGAFDYIELDLLTFLQAAESICLDGREMHKYILPILAADETITLGVVKPLYCSCFHGGALFLYSLDMR